MLRFSLILMSVMWFQVTKAQVAIPLKKEGLHVKGILKVQEHIYQSPSPGARRLRTLHPYDILFLYETDHPDYYRVGSNNTEAEGYIPKSAVLEWNHRISLHFTPIAGREPALVYASEEDVAQEIRDGQALKDRAIAEEPSNQANRYKILFPIIDQTSVNGRGGVEKAYQVAYMGGEGSGRRPTQARRQPQVAKLQVMFVIDATFSMEEYIRATQEVVQQIAKRMSGLQETGVEFGLVLYRDYMSDLAAREAMGPVVERVIEPTGAYNDVINALYQSQTAMIGSEEKPEAMFDGVFEAITGTQWETAQTLKLVVVVGDASGHDEGSEKNPMDYQVPRIQRVASDEGVRVIALKLRTGTDDDLVHQNQMKQMAEGYGMGDGGFYDQIDISSRVNRELYIDRLTANLESEVARWHRLVKVVQNPVALNQVAREDYVIFRNLLAQGTSQGAQSVEFQQGWIAERSPMGKPQVSPYVFLTRDELETCINHLTAISNASSGVNEKIVAVQLEVLGSQTGEAYTPDVYFGSFLRQSLALPKTSRSLNFSLREIQAWPEDRKQNMMAAIQEKAKTLQSYLEDADNWIEFEDGGLQYTFLPLEYLP